MKDEACKRKVKKMERLHKSGQRMDARTGTTISSVEVFVDEEKNYVDGRVLEMEAARSSKGRPKRRRTDCMHKRRLERG